MFQTIIKWPIWSLFLFLSGCATNKHLVRIANQRYVLDSLRQDEEVRDGKLLWKTIKYFDPGEFRYLFLSLYIHTKVGGKVKIDRLTHGGKEVLEIELDLDQEKIKWIKDFVKLPTIKPTKAYQYYFACERIADQVYNDVYYDNCLVILKSSDKSGYYFAYFEAFGNAVYQESPRMHVVNFQYIKSEDRESLYKIKDRKIVPQIEGPNTEQPETKEPTNIDPTTEEPKK